MATAPAASEQITWHDFDEDEHPWKDAVLDELVMCSLDAPLSDSPRALLNKIINWHVDVATDPAVNGGFKLVQVIQPRSFYFQEQLEPDPFFF